jgi:phosphoribosylformylglycinamidine synthase
VSPTLLITALGIVPDIRKAVTMDIKEAGDALYIVGVTKPELGGSEYYALHSELGASVPKLEPEKNARAYACLNEAMDRGIVRACHDLSDGGLGVTAAEMAFTGDLGLDIDLARVPTSEEMRDDFVLFSESNGRLLAEVLERDSGEFEALMGDSVFARIGTVKEDKTLRVKKNGELLFELTLTKLIGAWKTPLEEPR